MDERNSHMWEMLVVMEQGKAHAHGTLPRVGEVLSLFDGLYYHFYGQQVENGIVPSEDVTRHLWIEVIQVEGDGE